ncbi:helix-turn-helix domain-containing protein [Methylobacterium nigriterrae]|uniref:helix-turn-helix domain-containing protein n=1 Tax=Methylobacterium nigriterrae TaxID=3127512 RepID=UPI003013E69D
MRTLEKAIAMFVGDSIRTARLRKGVTLRELADAIGVALVTLREYEVGRTLPNESRRAVIADALGVPAVQFTPPDLIEVTPDERDLVSAYRRSVCRYGMLASQRVIGAICEMQGTH